MKEISYAQAIREALAEEMVKDPDVFLMGEDIALFGGAFGVTGPMWKEFGLDRVRDTPISEAALVGAGVGAAIMGMKPVVEIMFGDFLPIAMDQIVNQAAKARFMSGGRVSVPLTIRVTTGATGSAGAHHSQSLESWFTNIPGLKVVVPASPADAKALLKSAIRDPDPVIFFEHKRLYNLKGPVPEGDVTCEFGKANIVREGGDITIIAISGMLVEAMDAAEELAQYGIDVEVVDPRTLLPLDTDTFLKSVEKTSRVLIVQEAYAKGGPAAEIAAHLAEYAMDYLDCPIARIGAKFAPHSYNPEQEKFILPDKNSIVATVRRMVGR